MEGGAGETDGSVTVVQQSSVFKRREHTTSRCDYRNYYVTTAPARHPRSVHPGLGPWPSQPEVGSGVGDACGVHCGGWEVCGL